MTKKTILILLLFISCAIHAIAQSDFYYYRGKKMPLPLNENIICISIPKDSSNVIERVRTNVQVSDEIRDNYYYIIVVSRSDYEKLTSLNTWEEDLKSIVITPCYYDQYNNPIVASPYLNVELKQQQDTVLLASYAKEYKLIVFPSSEYFPLWYIVAITPNSPKNSVECANELYETGVFENSIPDLVELVSFVELEDELAVQLIPTTPAVKSIVLYDLSGQKTNTPSGLTIVVTRYSDGTIRTEKKLIR